MMSTEEPPPIPPVIHADGERWRTVKTKMKENYRAKKLAREEKQQRAARAEAHERRRRETPPPSRGHSRREASQP